MLNVVHISTYDNGGAGNAAMRLHLGLLEKGVHSTFLCLKKTTNQKNVIAFTEKKRFFESVFFRTPFNAIGLPIDKVNQNHKTLSRLTGDYELFTFPDSNFDVLSHPLVKKADIINLHWVAKYLDYSSFFPNVNKPVVWTLHDMNPIQGGFHYYDEVVRTRGTFDSIENKLKEQKAHHIKTCKNLTIVAPSKWLHQLAINSKAFASASHLNIPYGLPTAIFKDYEKETARKVFGLPLDKTIISFVSSDIHSPRKGFDLLYDAVKKMSNREDVIFCAVGCAPRDIKEDNLVFLGDMKDERLMALLYSASDGYILPSREDNFPNVMLEAMACGTPVLSFAVGGMRDVIQPGFNGEFAGEVSVASLVQSLDGFIKNIARYNRSEIRQNILDNYNLDVQAGNYIHLYNRILKRNQVVHS
jgi:glycosyltransferase involved in cell wall biosynthesis